jgi:YD repeat-containing protein
LNLATEKNDTVSYFRVYNGKLLISDSSSEVARISKYEYNEKGRLAEKTIDYSSELIGRIISNYYYTYNDEERIEEVKTFITSDMNNMKPELFSHKIMTYNEKGWLMSENEKVIKDETGSIVYAYDTLGRCIQVAKEKAETKNYTYDSKGLLLKKTTQMKDSDMEFTMTHAFSYRFYEQEE